MTAARAAARTERTTSTMDEAPIIYAVPVRELPGRLVGTVRTGRSPQGQRVGIAFTRPELLVAAMGADQAWEELCESALRGMLRPLGIDRIQVDPLLVAPPLDPSFGDRAAPTVPALVPAALVSPRSGADPVAVAVGTFQRPVDPGPSLRRSSDAVPGHRSAGRATPVVIRTRT
ncbi:SAV_915 family protein [Micromonospora sp. NPDC005173]|uniref:SAV_915 family protein n=1 Tax=Micromonospora sp. NPDC005173 TaxID=3157165 RepID=UPI0033BBC5B4